MGASSTTSTSSGAGSGLARTQWVLQDSASLPTQGLSVTLEFVADQVTGTSGCNTYRAPYKASGSKLTIGPDIASTRMACPPPADTVESAYLQALPKVATYAVQGATLRLLDASGGALLVYTKADLDAALLGRWEATGYYTGTAIQSVVGDATLTADFEGTNVSGNAGCNNFNGAFQADRDQISMGPFASTMMACADDALPTQEQQYLAALEAAKTFRVRGDQLELHRADGGIAATFTRATPG